MLLVLLGFETLLWAYVISFLVLKRNIDMQDVPAKTERIFVRNCYIHVGCTEPREYESFHATVETKKNEFRIDGSTSLRCQINLCLEKRTSAQPLAIFSSRSVLNFNDAESLDSPLSVSSWDLYPGTTTKFMLDGMSLPQLSVNLTQGIVVLDRLNCPDVNVVNGHGPVYMQSDFSLPWNLSAVLQDGGYCITPNVSSWSAPPCTTAGNTCAFHASSNGTTGGTLTNYKVNASSLYLHDYVYGLSEEVFEYNGTRIGGSLMETTPIVSDWLLQMLNQTETWAAKSTFDDYVQAIEVVTPSLGTLYLNGRKRITMEIGPEWLAFLSAYALRVYYRRLSTTLNHYRCRDVIGVIEDRPGSLVNLHQGSSWDYDEFQREDFGNLIENHFISDDQYQVGLVLHAAATPESLHNSITVFTSPAQEFSKVGDLSGNPWKYYYFAPQSDGSIILRELSQSPTAVALVILSLCSACFLVLALYALIYTQRYNILKSVMLQNQRELLRNALDYKRRCPYLNFFSVLTLTSWVTFRVGLYLLHHFQFPGRKRPFGRFLSYYFKVVGGGEDVTEAKGQRLAMEQVATMHERWCLLRYRTNDSSMQEIYTELDRYGARRHTDTKLTLLGVRAKRGTTDTMFTLSYTSLQSFYQFTKNPRDEALFDDLYLRCVSNSITIDEDELVRKLQQWKIQLRRKPLEIVGNVLSRNTSQLTDEAMAPLVAKWEENASSFPSIAILEHQTTGTTRIKTRGFFFAFWVLFESIGNFVVAFFPFILAYLATLPLEIEHSRYTTSTSILMQSELMNAVTDYTGPKPQSRLSIAIYLSLVTFTTIMTVEPFFVALTFRQVSTWSHRRSWRLQYFVLYLRWLLTIVAYVLLFLIWTYMIVFVINAMVWWVLGAIIAPNRMLVYCSSILTFLYILYSTHVLDNATLHWLPEVQARCSEHSTILLVGNTTDLDQKRVVSSLEGEQCAEEHQLHFLEISAKESLDQVDLGFSTISSAVHDKVMDGTINPFENTCGILVREEPNGKIFEERHTGRGQRGGVKLPSSKLEIREPRSRDRCFC